MSVIRRQGFGRRTRRRLADVRVALYVSLSDAALIGCWFTLLVVEPRRPFTALAGLTVLVFGALIRTNLIIENVSARHPNERPLPRRIATGVLFAGIWVAWLLVAERVGSAVGIAAATVLLVFGLVSYFGVQWYVVSATCPPVHRTRRRVPSVGTVLVPSIAIGFAAATLLWLVWYGGPTLASTSLSVGESIVYLELPVVISGIFVLWCGSFLGTHRFLRSLPGW
ncbi:hypothetical protein [Halovivax gelatinilyticus]|uniref:hypothetical protein n=1 Tax=Halovivax gelatinilyticus TaxID=2961597 RepID=UPI0020CA8DC9|nr:hypothetical protein [Halovivax gelatinilyticus]